MHFSGSKAEFPKPETTRKNSSSKQEIMPIELAKPFKTNAHTSTSNLSYSAAKSVSTARKQSSGDASVSKP